MSGKLLRVAPRLLTIYRGLAIISKDRIQRLRAIAEHIASASYDIVCLQELWVYKDYEMVREEIQHALPFSRFFHTGALGSGLAIFTRFPLIGAQAFPYSLSGTPAQAFAGDFFVKKAAGNVVILHPVLGEVEIWNTHMHAAGEHGPDTRQAHRIAESWQLASAIRGGAAKGRYILVTGDFNSQPGSVPIAMMRDHANLQDSFLVTHPSANTDLPHPPSSAEALIKYGTTCDSPLCTYSAGKPIPGNVLEHGGKRLDYIFYRQPAVARKRPLVWKYRDDAESAGAENGGAGLSGDAYIETGKPLQNSMAQAPKLRCISSEVILTDRVPGHQFSYSDHFALLSTFTIEGPSQQYQSHEPPSATDNGSHGPSTANSLEPLISQNDPERIGSNLYAAGDPFKYPSDINLSPSTSIPFTQKSNTIRSALNTLRLYTRISQHTAKRHLQICLLALLALIGLTVGCAWQPKSWLQPIFTIIGALLGATAATFLYTGFVWGRWEEGLLTEITEEMELELRVVEMEENMNR
ncbi:hypothetical protein I350_02801 [Cryptococcus amylolentus CBS 6273]|uniref:Endonuclease/exonuclease/phosphatase domain-containing protein n=1 Tax=Cryptococcus amylolentus CBS 6273 TaxID=1296118 RepID=A0A1E3K801_9TREE|nr:hypothetical protein I350_02801 [Cryptococcus amylolentus CBS 6273]